MQVRLAFAVSIHANREILLMDEVLAVGDSNFQHKCFDYFADMKGKKTIILVTHEPSFAKRFCDRIAILDRSKIVKIGLPDEILNRYEHLISAK